MQHTLQLEPVPILEVIRKRLRKHLGPLEVTPRLDPISQLVKGILSSRTRDEVSWPTLYRLRRHFESWERVEAAAPIEIERVIEPVTFPDRKAEQIVEALKEIRARVGALTLDFLAEWPEEKAMDWLTSLTGVGPKIAASVLNFSTIGRREFVVDTHLVRIGQRLGLVRSGAGVEGAHAAYLKLLPGAWDAADCHEMHCLMKAFGQRACTHGEPACKGCPLRDLCRWEAAQRKSVIPAQAGIQH